MDRNQIIGLVVMMAFITVYFTFFAPEPPEEVQTTEQTTPDQNKQKSTSQEVSQPIRELSDSAKAQINSAMYGIFSPAAIGEEKSFELVNNDLRITFNTKGGVVDRTELLKYKDYLGNPVILTTKENSDFHLYVDHLGKTIDLSDFYFTASQSKKADTSLLTFKLDLNEYTWVKYTYSLAPNGYEVGFDIETRGMSDIISEKVRFGWNHKFNRLEMDINDSRTRTTVRYCTVLEEDVDYLSPTSSELEEETIAEPVKWMAFKQKFFTSAIIADDAFKSSNISTRVDPTDSLTTKAGTMEGVIPYENFVAGKLGFRYFFGPNDFDLMRTITPEFEQNVNQGWGILSWINQHFIRHIFRFLEGFFTNYGIIILIMVVIVRIILSPLTYKSHMSMAKMRVLKPELDEIKERNKDDMQKAQKEQMDLYRQVGINPLSGCIPMVLQMPILFSLFYFFPNAIELRQEAFLWSSDLSTYDNVMNLPFTIPFYGSHVSLFTLLMTVSTILYTWSNSQITSVTGPMKTLQYIMPIMFLFFLNSFSSGLTFYYFVSNMSTFGQTFLFKKFIDEDKIKRILEDNRKNNVNKKKSKFQMKLEEAMKANQEAQKKKKNK